MRRWEVKTVDGVIHEVEGQSYYLQDGALIFLGAGQIAYGGPAYGFALRNVLWWRQVGEE